MYVITFEFNIMNAATIMLIYLKNYRILINKWFTDRIKSFTINIRGRLVL